MDKNPTGNPAKSNAAMRERVRPRGRNYLLEYTFCSTHLEDDVFPFFTSQIPGLILKAVLRQIDVKPVNVKKKKRFSLISDSVDTPTYFLKIDIARIITIFSLKAISSSSVQPMIEVEYKHRYPRPG